jgi:hypothetical protein
MEKAIAEAEGWLNWLYGQWGAGKVIIHLTKDGGLRVWPEPSPPVREGIFKD